MNMTITINFDMDGTLANLYGVKGWLADLESGSTRPYEEAEPMLRMSALAKRLNNLQKQGYKLGIISWTSRDGSSTYNEAVEEAKKEWLNRHLPSVHWDEMNIIPYGVPKELLAHNAWDILFDDEQKNRENWTGEAFDANQIMEILANL